MVDRNRLLLNQDGALLQERLVDRGDGTFAQRVEAYPPKRLMTDNDGQSARLRVDVGQTGFFAGREFRTFRELNMPGGTTLFIQAIVPIDIILFGLDVEVESGAIKVETIAGAVDGGVWSETLPILPRNTMSERPTPIYSPQVQLKAGGAPTGGTVIDVLRAKTAGNSNQAATVGASGQDERGVGAATYYFKLIAAAGDAVVGVFRARWEERT